MKYFIFVVFLLSLFSACGPSGNLTVNELLHDKSFNSTEFFNSKISIYSPYIVNYANQKYPNISEVDLTNVVLNKVKDKLSGISNNQNIKIENRTAPDLFRGIKLKPGEGEQFLKSSKSDYLLIIQSVTVGTERSTKTQSIDPYPVPPGIKDAGPNPNTAMEQKNSIKNTTQATITYDIWDVKKRVSVFVVEASVVLVDGLNHKDPYLSIEKVTEALINKISGKEE